MTTAHRLPHEPATSQRSSTTSTSVRAGAWAEGWSGVLARVHRGWLATGALLFAIGLTIGTIVSAVGSRGTGELALDVTISHHRDGVLTAVAKAINVVDGSLLGPLILLLVCAAIWWRSRSSAVILGGLTLLAWLSVGTAKILFHRHRPPGGTVHALIQETGLDSFPSGHTAFVAAAVAASVVTLHLAGRSVRPALLIGIPVVLVVALSRLYLGAHFYGDVLGAPFFTTGTVLGACALARPFVLRRQPAAAA